MPIRVWEEIMPRPKSEMTGVATTVSARLINAHYAEWKRLGGVAWLRQFLKDNIEQRRKQEQTNELERKHNQVL